MKIVFGHLSTELLLCCLLLGGLAAPASAQFKLQESFEGATAPGWTLSNSAVLTAPSIDAAGSGWLRLTAALGSEKGLAINSGFSFAGNQPVTVEFSYVAWGGTGADGMSLFLYDSATLNPMAGAFVGGGLGYCGGAGGYLAIGLDEYGNFSNPGDRCTSASGGPGFSPESVVIRGPESSTNAWVTTTSVPGAIDNPGVAMRPSPKTVLLTLTPAVAPAAGYTITAQFRSASGQPFQTLFSNVPFTYAPPASLAVGLSASTGGATNNHEVQQLIAATPDDLQVTMTGPASALQGEPVIYNVTLTNNGNYALNAANAPTVVDNLPASIIGATWTCTGANGAACDTAGTGDINTSNVTLPVNASVTYTIRGTLDTSAVCGSTLTNSANADFGSTTSFLDPDETNNSYTVNSQVLCNTLVANPAALTYAPQQVSVASASEAVTLTGINSASINSITVTGDYSQTNDCPVSLPAAQTCTINLVFTPTVVGSRNGTLTIVSTAAASAPLTSVVMLSGTGINSAPSPFSFTPLINVDPSSVQVSNSITIANTNVPSPISVSAGGQYSINGGPFTAVPGIVSPGAQVQVQLTAASGYSTSDAAVLTIGGVSSTFMVTTGAQPVIQGGFAPVNGAAPSSVQVSNGITVTGAIPAPISVSSGSQYSIDGGPFTMAAGTIMPGDMVRVQTIASADYSTTTSTILTIGGVASTFTVTTAAQPVIQGGFTPVSGAPPSSVQVSNPITVTGTIPAPISVTSGSQYSINGGPFTMAAGTISPGDQVRVQTSASSAYNTTTSAVLTIGDISSTFTVTTGTQPVIQGAFLPVTGATPSSVQVSNSITVGGITAPAAITISSGATYSIKGGPFTTAAGTVSPGDQVRVQLAAPTTYDTTATAVLAINGVQITFSVTTGSQPLTNVAVTGGGGAIGILTLLMLALIGSLKLVQARRAALVLPVAVVILAALLGSQARADNGSWMSGIYGGIRLGDSNSSMTAAKLTRGLQVDGYQITAAGSERGTASGTLYIGYELRDNFAVEIAGTYVGRTRAALTGVATANLHQLLADAAHIVRGSGDIVSLEARYRWHLARLIDLDLRAGPYIWLTTAEVYVSGVDELSQGNHGLGYTLGGGPRFSLGQHLGIGVAADYLRSTVETHFVVFSATLEYHFR